MDFLKNTLELILALVVDEVSWDVLCSFFKACYPSKTSFALLNAEDIETSLGDYLKALDILESLVEPDSRRIAELYPFPGCKLNHGMIFSRDYLCIDKLALKS